MLLLEPFFIEEPRLSHNYFLRKKTDYLRPYLTKHSLILDVGCGKAKTKDMIDANVIGVDLKKNLGLDIQADCRHLPFPNNIFDLVFSMCLFHHVKEKDRLITIQEMKRVTKNLVVSFDHNPWNPLTRLMTKTCDLDEDAQLLTKREMHILFLDGGLVIDRASYIIGGGQYAIVGVKQ